MPIYIGFKFKKVLINKKFQGIRHYIGSLLALEKLYIPYRTYKAKRSLSICFGNDSTF